MKKDKEWLKNEVKSLFDEAYDSGKMEYYESEESIHRINNLIDQLDEPETLSEEWIESHTASADTISYYSEDSVPVVTVSNLKGLLVPNQDKPVIPQFVADWIDTHNLYGNNPLREYRDLESDFNEGWTDEKDASVYHWINKNPYTFIDALRYGHDVEKEKLYQVELPTERLHHILTMHGDGKGHFFGKEHTNNFWYRTYLTEQEIKAIDERFWVFAEEVTQ